MIYLIREENIDWCECSLVLKPVNTSQDFRITPCPELSLPQNMMPQMNDTDFETKYEEHLRSGTAVQNLLDTLHQISNINRKNAAIIVCGRQKNVIKKLLKERHICVADLVN